MTCIEIIKAISIIIASLVAIYGLDSWRRELRDKRRIELAEETLTLFYQAFDAINYMRFPGSYGYEGKSREKEEGESDDAKEVRDNAYVLIERYKPYEKIFSRIQSLRYRFMAIFGKDCGEPFVRIRKLVNILFLSARKLARLWAKKSEEILNDKELERHHKSIKEEESIFWEGSIEEDKTKKELNQIILDIEKICKPVLLGKNIFKRIE